MCLTCCTWSGVSTYFWPYSVHTCSGSVSSSRDFIFLLCKKIYKHTRSCSEITSESVDWPSWEERRGSEADPRHSGCECGPSASPADHTTALWDIFKIKCFYLYNQLMKMLLPAGWRRVWTSADSRQTRPHREVWSAESGRPLVDTNQRQSSSDRQKNNFLF